MEAPNRHRLYCPACGGVFRVLATQAGDIVTCPHCEAISGVPRSLPDPPHPDPLLARRVRIKPKTLLPETAPSKTSLVSAVSLWSPDRKAYALAAVMSIAVVCVIAGLWHRHREAQIRTYYAGTLTFPDYTEGGLSIRNLSVRYRPDWTYAWLTGEFCNTSDDVWWTTVEFMHCYKSIGPADWKVLASIEVIPPHTTIPFAAESDDYFALFAPASALIGDATFYLNAIRRYQPPATPAPRPDFSSYTGDALAVFLGVGMQLAMASFLLFLCGVVGARCAASRGRQKAGFWLGAILGPLGWLFALMLPVPLPEYLTATSAAPTEPLQTPATADATSSEQPPLEPRA